MCTRVPGVNLNSSVRRLSLASTPPSPAVPKGLAANQLIFSSGIDRNIFTAKRVEHNRDGAISLEVSRSY